MIPLVQAALQLAAQTVSTAGHEHCSLLCYRPPTWYQCACRRTAGQWTTRPPSTPWRRRRLAGRRALCAAQRHLRAGTCLPYVLDCSASSTAAIACGAVVTQVSEGQLRSALRCARERGWDGAPSGACMQKPLLEFQHAKLALEAKLQEAQGITHSIVRPTAFFKSVAGQVRGLTSTSGIQRRCFVGRGRL